MMVDKEAELGLSLSLNLTHHNTHQQKQQQQQQQPHQFPIQAQNINLFPSFFNSAMQQQRASWNPFSSGLDQTSAIAVRPKAIIDVNRLPSTDEYTDDAGASSPNSTISSLSGKRSERDDHNNADHLDRAGACSGSDDEDGDNSRKKLRLSKDQSAVLEESFKEHNTLNPKQKMALSKQLGLRPRQVEVWFQNRRARTKLKQTEVDCESLKRCCENLTEENRRLQKEVTELRALKLSPQFYMQMAPPTTLTMCPSCERVGTGEGRSQSLNHQAGGVGCPPRPNPNPNPWAVAARPFDVIRPRS